MLYYQKLSFILEIIEPMFISRHHNNFLSVYLDINKMKEFIRQKYYWPSLRKDVEAYLKDCNVYLALKTIKYKPYSDLQALPILTYC